MYQFFASDDQSIGVSASASILPMNIQDRFPLGLTGLVFLLSKGLKNLLQHHSSRASILRCSAFFIVQISHLCMTTGKAIVLTRGTFVGKVMALLYNMLSRFVIAFLPRSKHLLISCLLHYVMLCYICCVCYVMLCHIKLYHYGIKLYHNYTIIWHVIRFHILYI